MAEDTVVREQLTDAMVRGGAALLTELDKSDISITAAFWWLDPFKSNEWRLLFASPAVPLGPKHVYERIHAALGKLGARGTATPLDMIGLITPNHPLVELLKLAVGIPPNDIGYVRLHRNTINGHFIEDCLIYRMWLPPQENVMNP